MRRAIAAGVGMLVCATGALTGCAQEPPTFDTIGELSAAYLEAGGTCTDLVEQYQAEETDPVVATCGDSTVLTVSADADQAAAVVTGYRLQGTPVLANDTWAVVDPDVDDLVSMLGGTISVLEPSDGPANASSDGVLVDADGAVTGDGVGADGEPVARDGEAGVHEIAVFTDTACEYCATFDAANAEQLASWVDDGSATVEYRPVSLEDSTANGFASSRGADAVACVADASPDDVPVFLSSVLAARTDEGVPDADLVALADDLGVDIADCVADGEFLFWVRQATARAIASPLPGGDGFRGTPTVVVDGVVYEGAVDDPAAFAAFVGEQAA